MDHEQKTKFELDLESLEQTVEYQKSKRQQPEPKKEEKETDLEDSKVVPTAKWRAPEGWTPPGWNEERSMQVAKQFMGFQANPK